MAVCCCGDEDVVAFATDGFAVSVPLAAVSDSAFGPVGQSIQPVSPIANTPIPADSAINIVRFEPVVLLDVDRLGVFPEDRDADVPRPLPDLGGS